MTREYLLVSAVGAMLALLVMSSVLPFVAHCFDLARLIP